jgi:putative intracellular protease/amidase
MKNILIAILIGFVTSFAEAAEKKQYTRNVAIVVYKDAEPLDWTGPFEVWNDAAEFGSANGAKAFNVYVVSKTTEPVSSQGMIVVPNYSIDNAPKPDILVVPGGNSSNITNDPAFFAWVKKAAAEAEIAQTVCTGAFVLAKAGLLDGLEITTWYGAIAHLRDTFPTITVKDGRRYIDNGHYVTTAGISAGIDGSLHLVARLLGRRVADQVSRYMEYHWTPEAYLSTGYKYLNPSTDEHGRRIQSADVLREEKNFTEAAAIYRALVKQDASDRTAWYRLGQSLRGSADNLAAAEAFLKAAEGERTANAYYNAACAYAAANRSEEALAYLEKAVSAGFADRDYIKKDSDFAKLRDDPRFKAMTE